MLKLLNIPNALTLFRISLIPIFIILFYLPYKWHYLASAIVFAIASVTDYLDGYLARKLSQESAFGSFLDPVADKLTITVALILLVEEHSNIWFSIPAAVIVGREIVISALREWMSEIGEKHNITVSWLGKIKTSMQMVSIIMLLAIPPYFRHFEYVVLAAYVFLYIVVILTIWSMVSYLIAASKSFNN